MSHTARRKTPTVVTRTPVYYYYPKSGHTQPTLRPAVKGKLSPEALTNWRNQLRPESKVEEALAELRRLGYPRARGELYSRNGEIIGFTIKMVSPETLHARAKWDWMTNDVRFTSEKITGIDYFEIFKNEVQKEMINRRLTEVKLKLLMNGDEVESWSVMKGK